MVSRLSGSAESCWLCVAKGWRLPTLIVTGDSPQTKKSKVTQMRDSLPVRSMVAAYGEMEVQVEKAALSMLTMPSFEV
jgi:hypothetical protein